MSWLITLLGGVPASIHAALVNKEQATRLALEDVRKERDAQVSALREGANVAVLQARKELEERIIALENTLVLSKKEQLKTDAQLLKSKDALLTLQKSLSDAETKLYAAISEKKAAEAERLAALKDLGLLKIQLENLQNNLIQVQTEAAYALQRLEDTSTVLDALRKEHDALLATVPADAPAPTPTPKPERKRKS